MLTSLLMNRLLLGRQYHFGKYLSVFLITVGIILCTLATAGLEKVEKRFVIISKMLKEHRVDTVVGGGAEALQGVGDRRDDVGAI